MKGQAAARNTATAASTASIVAMPVERKVSFRSAATASTTARWVIMAEAILLYLSLYFFRKAWLSASQAEANQSMPSARQ